MAAQRLADTASRIRQAADRQRDQLERLTSLRDRIAELLAACQRLGHKPGPAQGAPKPTAEAPPKPSAPPTLPSPAETLRPLQEGRRPRLPAAAFVEFSNWREFDKFRRMAPISGEEVAACDIDELLRRLAEP